STALGADRPLERRNRPRAEARRAEPLVPGVGVSDRECGKLDAGMARKRRLELAAERRVGGLEQHLHVARRQHRADISRPCRSAGGRHLPRRRRRREAGARERPRRGLRATHEVADMVEKNLIAERQLAINFCHLGHFAPLIRSLSWPSYRTSLTCMTRLSE